MSAHSFLTMLYDAGVRFNVQEGRLSIRYPHNGLTPADLDRLKALKATCLQLLDRLFTFRSGHKVQTAGGNGRIYEIYPRENRCGVLLEGQEWPIFLSIFEIEPYLYRSKRDGL